LIACDPQTTRKQTPTAEELTAFGLGDGKFTLPTSLKMKKVEVITEPKENQKKAIYIECYNVQETEYTSLMTAFSKVTKNDAFSPVSFAFDHGFKYIATYDYEEKNERYNVYALFCLLDYSEGDITYVAGTLILEIVLNDDIAVETTSVYTLFSRVNQPNDHELSNLGLDASEITYFDQTLEAVDVNSTKIKNQSKMTLVFKESTEDNFSSITDSYYQNFANRRDGYLTDEKSVVLYNTDTELVFRADYFRNEKGFQCEIIYYTVDTLIGNRLLVPEKTLTVRFCEISNYVTHEYYYRKNIEEAYEINEIPEDAEWAIPGLIININSTATDLISVYGVKHTPGIDGNKYYFEIALQYKNETSKFMQLIAGLNSKMSFTDSKGEKVNLNTLIKDGKAFDSFVAYYVIDYYKFSIEINCYKQETSDENYLYPKGTVTLKFSEL
jgi:hypothetical protein